MTISFDAPLSAVPYLQNWLGVWAIEEQAFRQLEQQVSQITLAQHLQTTAMQVANADGIAYQMHGTVAVIDVCGVMMKQRMSMGLGCSTVEVRRQLSLANADAQVQGIVLRFETPGGTAAGTMELANAIASSAKPTMAYCNDLTASAGYWAASQCDSISANVMAQVGSIGTYAKVEDTSGQSEKEGVKVHVIRAGEYKGAMTPGTVIEEKHIAEMQRMVDGINQHFVSAVQSVREFTPEQMVAIADGRVHIAADAKRLGLIDSIESFEQAVERFAAEVSVVSPSVSATLVSNGDSAMADETKPVTVAATAKELKERFPKSNADWRLNAIENAWTIEQCTEAYASLMEARAEAAEQRAEEAERRAAKPGVSPVSFSSGKFRSESDEKANDDEKAEDDEKAGDYEDDEESAKSVWECEVAKSLKQCRGDRVAAVKMANRKNPGLREAMLAEVNAGRRVR